MIKELNKSQSTNKRFNIIKLFLLPFAIAILGCFLFFVVSLIPQNAIQYNASQSAKELNSQSQWPIALNKGDKSYTMDNFTDSQIIMQSYNLTSQNIGSILENPKHVSDQDTTNMALALDEVVNQGAENEISYSRYWMGFRLFVRPLLMVFSYFEMRKLVAAIFFALLVLAVVVISKKVNTKTAVCFGLAIIPCNPAIISHSLQFSCTFLLAFLFVIYVCMSENASNNILPLFCTFGALTQFFDFYTTPLVTYGFPVLIMLSMDVTAKNKLLTAIKTFFTWTYGYVGIWVVKLLFTTLFTDSNGFADGFSKFAERTGITIQEGTEKYYNVSGAFKAVLNTVLPGGLGKIILCLFALIVCVSIITIFFKRKLNCALNDIVPFVVALIPIIWFGCSAQPTYIHAWFQYRSLAVTFFGVFLTAIFAAELLKRRLLNAKVKMLEKGVK